MRAWTSSAGRSPGRRPARAHRITLGGESEGLAGRLLMEPGDDGERLDMALLRGQLLLPLAGIARRLDIVLDETG